MPNEFSDAPYELVRHPKNPLKRSPKLPPSDKNTLTPGYLMQHENHFDPNVVTPEQQMQKETHPIQRA